LLTWAGAGVTPMMARATTRFDLGGNPDICYVQCAKQSLDLVFRRKLEAMASRVPRINPHYVAIEDDAHSAWTGVSRHLEPAYA
jgi:stachydrine N-demethylase, reductase component